MRLLSNLLFTLLSFSLLVQQPCFALSDGVVDEGGANNPSPPSTPVDFEEQRQSLLIRGHHNPPNEYEEESSQPELHVFLAPNTPSTSVVTSNSCYSHTDCQNCTKTTVCHWCSHDQRCHAMGSVFGCALGSSCHPPPPQPPKPQADACTAYPNCTACSAFHTCHWCAHDDSCHVVGSPYGCVRGVDCFAEERCRRKSSEPLPPGSYHFTNMGGEALLAVFVVGLTLLFCLSCCLYCVCGLKGSYDDLLSVISPPHRHIHADYSMSMASSMNPDFQMPSSETITPVDNDDENQVASAATMTSIPESEQQGTSDVANTDTIQTTQTPSTSTGTTESTQQPKTTVEENKVADSAAAETTTQQLGRGDVGLERQLTADSDYFYQALEEEQEQQEGTPLLSAVAQNNLSVADGIHDDEGPATPFSSSKHMRRIVSACTCLYILAILIVGGVMFAAMRFFPKIPEYSVCNDDVAWRKLIDSMARFKTEIDFEILMSIENANHVGVALDEGHGVFRHGDEQVGHYIVPPVSVAAMAVTDVMIIATLTPDRKQVISLTRDYYEDILVLSVDIDLTLRTPSMFNYSKEVTITDRPVQINQKEDRHLCACKKWSNHTIPALRL